MRSFERCEERIVFSGVDLGALAFVAPAAAPVAFAADTLPTDADTGLTSASAEYARQVYGLRGEGQTVAIIDSGIAYDHPALGGGLGAEYRVVGGWDFTEENDADPYDDGPAGFHGTHVAGIIASDDSAHMGIAPGVDLLALRVFNDFGSGSIPWVEQALQWVYEARDDFRYPITTVNLSLGVSWNDLVLPGWASLENELAALEQAGIFVAVAAGNSYEPLGSIGLSYPAVSPHVVPVASVNAAGNLSDFSQRGPSVLAAAGEGIVSTVPDHIYGADGILDDWAASTGTSMAAPLVAGASVLVREAMQLTGHATIDQSVVYGHLKSTADLVFDPSTNAWYHRINLQRALDAIVPNDDFGSSAATAYDLGTLIDTFSLHGQLGRLSDQDHFTFVAGATGLVTFEWDAGAEILAGSGTVDPTDQEANDRGQLTLDVIAGQTYHVSVAAHERLAVFDLTLDLKAQHAVQLHDGTLRIEGTGGDDQVHITIGESVVVELNGHQFDFAFDTVLQFEVHGRGGNDILHVQAGLHGSGIGRASTSTFLRPGTAQIDAVQWQLAADDFENITVVAPGGHDDVARLYDSPSSDEYVARPHENVLKGPGFENRVVGYDRVYAYASAGDDDVARMYDSSGSDQFLSHPEFSILRGEGFHNKALAFDRVYAYASSGSDDVARFYDSAGNDELIAAPESTSLAGEGYFNKATDFDRTYAYCSAGSDDVARFFDSAGNDEFVARVHDSLLRGTGFYNRAIGFDRVYAEASGGNDDVARLHDSPYDDVFLGGHKGSVLRGNGFHHQATGFDRVYGYASVGQDVARLTGTVENDRFYSWTGRGVLRGAAYYADARGFQYTYADLVGGQDDVAYLYDSAGDDTYIGIAGRGLWQAGGFSTEIQEFDRVRAFSARGGDDVAVLRSSLPSQFTESGSVAVLSDSQSRHELNNFEHVALDGIIDDSYLANIDSLFKQLW